MNELVKVSLENELDIILAYKKAIRLAEKLDLAVSTQTTFATAVSEICRELIDKTDSGLLILGLTKEEVRYSITAVIKYNREIEISQSEEGLQYAQRLVSQLVLSSSDDCNLLEVSIGLPRWKKIDHKLIRQLEILFRNEPPYTPYEEIKLKKQQLSDLTEEMDEELKYSKYINEKKNEFISIASHELKTPVTIIKAYSQLALNASGKDKCSEKVDNFIRKIEEQSIKLAALIQQLLDISKIESGKMDYKMEVVDLDKFVRDSVSTVSHAIPNHTISVDTAENVEVRLDRLRIEQVLTNILGNAAKYSPVGSTIALNISRNPGDGAVVSVRDCGIGINKSNLDSIFKKFYREKQVALKYSGLGMGLYISSKIIDGHGGRIWVDSIEGEGSTFHFTLPLLQD